MPQQCPSCGLQNPDERETCWSCMQSLEPFDTVGIEPCVEATWYAPFLDAMAGLCWLKQTKSICAATTVLLDMSSKSKPKLKFLVASNICPLVLGLTENQGIADLAGLSCETKLKLHRDSWSSIVDQKLLKLATPKEDPDLFKILNSAMVSMRDVVIIGGSDHTHAEMKLLDELFKGTYEPLGSVVYIGISAVCCDNCYEAIRAFNSALKEFDYDYRISVFGHHPVQYSAGEWPLPKFLSTTEGDSTGNILFSAHAARQFFGSILGGKSAFLGRKDHKQDESMHQRPVWVSKDEGASYVKASEPSKKL